MDCGGLIRLTNCYLVKVLLQIETHEFMTVHVNIPVNGLIVVTPVFKQAERQFNC